MARSPDSGASSTKKTILVVDDDPICLRAMVRVLSGEFSVLTADGIFEALSRCSSNQLSAILCDYDMPFSDGLQVISSIRSMGHGVPAAIVTGASGNVQVQEALRKGFIDDVIYKPFGAEELMRAVRRMLESGHAQSGPGREADLRTDARCVDARDDRP